VQSAAGDLLYDVIQNKQLDFSDDIWGDVTIEARLLVKSLLQRDAKSRPTAAQIVTDPWVKTLAFTSESHHPFCMHIPHPLILLFSLQPALPVLIKCITQATKLARYGFATIFGCMHQHA